MKLSEAETARILDESVDKILRKEVTIAEVLKQYPGLKGELDAVSWVMQHQPQSASIQAFIHRSKPLLLSKLTDRSVIRRSPLWFLHLNRSIQLRAAVFFIVILLLGSMSGIVFAARAALPGDSFYPVKLVLENWQGSLIRDTERKTAFDIYQMETRLSEVDRLVDQSDDQSIDQAFIGYEKAVQSAVAEIDNEDIGEEQKEQLVLKLQEKLTDHLNHLEQLRDRLPDQAQSGLDRAILASAHGLSVAQDAVLGNHPAPQSRVTRTPTSTPTATASVTATPTSTATPKVPKPTKTEKVPPVKGANDPQFTPGPPEKTSPSENRPTQKPKPTEKDNTAPVKPEKTPNN